MIHLFIFPAVVSQAKSRKSEHSSKSSSKSGRTISTQTPWDKRNKGQQQTTQQPTKPLKETIQPDFEKVYIVRPLYKTEKSLRRNFFSQFQRNRSQLLCG